MQSSLITRNIRVHERRTSVRLEPSLWRALEVISEREGLDLNTLCSRIADLPRAEGGFTSALRVFIVRYFAGTALTGDVEAVSEVLGGAPKTAARARRR